MILLAAVAFADVALVPMPPLVADGTTPGTVRFVVDHPDRLRVKSRAGELRAVTIDPDGLVTVRFVPARAREPGVARIDLVEDNVGRTVEVPVVPHYTGDLDVTLDPPSVGAGGTATVTVRPTDPSPIPPELRPIRLEASVGTVGAPTFADGKWTATYTAPKTLAAPTYAAVLASDASAPGAITGYEVVPLTHRKVVQFSVPAGTANALHLGAATFGPSLADAAGRVTFEADLDPRLPAGFIVRVATSGERTEQAVMIPGVPNGHLAWVSAPAAVPAGGGPVRLQVLALGANGEPDREATVKVTASAGTVSAVNQTLDVHEVRFTPPATGKEVVLTAEVGGKRAERRIRLVPAGAATGLPPARLAVWPQAAMVAPGGAVGVSALVLDAFGVPVPNVEVAFSAPMGTIGSTARTDARGFATVAYTAGGVGVAAVRASVAGLWAEAPIAQGVERLLPPGGPLDVDQTWVARHDQLPRPPAVKPSALGVPSRLHVAAAPAYVSRGAVLVTAQLLNLAGEGIPGFPLGVSASVGTVGPIVDRGAGLYTFVVSLAPEQAGPITVTVTADNRSRSLVIPTEP